MTAPAPAPTEPRQRLVVVGAGMAAARLVEELTARFATGVSTGSTTQPRWDVTVLGDEPVAPYNRILLSAVLEGTHRPEALTLRSREWYAERGVVLRTGARVLSVDREHSDVMLVDGTTIHFDALVLATGAIPTLPPIRGLVRMDGTLHEAVHAFRSLKDCDGLQEVVGPGGREATVPRPQRAVVVGGGLLGLQVARALSVRGLDVEIVEGGDHLLRSQVGSQAGRILARDLKKLGTQVYTGARATRIIDGPEGRPELQLDNGAILDTDLVVLTAGGKPSTALARGADLEVRRGIVVDDQLRTSDPRIFAIGDCAQHRGRVTGFVPPAWDQARVLADVLTTDETAAYSGHRMVARLRATDLDVAVLGDPEAFESGDGSQVVEVSNPITGSHRKLVVKDGRIVAGALVGDLSRIGLITQHFDKQTVLGPTEPGDLLLADAPGSNAGSIINLPDDAEVCTCAGVTAGAIRACSSLAQCRDTTRATTGCGGCADTVRSLLASRPALATKGM